MINDCVNFALERRNIGFVMYGSRQQVADEMSKRVAAGEEVAMHGFKKHKKDTMPFWRVLAYSVNWVH